MKVKKGRDKEGKIFWTQVEEPEEQIPNIPVTSLEVKEYVWVEAEVKEEGRQVRKNKKGPKPTRKS